MVYSLNYRRPPHVNASRASLSGEEKQRSIGESTLDSECTVVSGGIPNALSFDRIISGGTCPVRLQFDLISGHTLCWKT